jgi:thiol-disulfide isomerase/thioredoxin
MPSLRLHALAGAAGLLVLAGAAFADDQKKDAYEPKARQLLGEVVQTYKSLPVYADHGELTLVAKRGTIQQKAATKRSVTFARPNKLVIDFGVGRLISDGNHVTAVLSPKKVYSTAPAPRTIDFHTLNDLELVENVQKALVGGEVGLPLGVLIDLLGSDDAKGQILEGTDGLRLEADSEVEGKAVRSLLVDQSKGPDIRLLVDPETRLVARISLVYNLEEVNAHAPAGQKFDAVTLDWNAGQIAREVPTDAFAFTPPEGFAKVDPAAPPAQAQGADKNLVDGLVGKPAPDFQLTVLDGDGKTKSVSKADLAGKVVMIDFWATWCGPCLRELPEVQKMVEAYARDKKDVVIVAVSQDDDPSDPAELRKLVEKTLAEKKLTLEGPVGRVALDPKHVLGDLFKIEALPTVVLIDAKGVVQAAHVGYSPEVRQTLTKGIDTLLDGKSLAKPGEPSKD